MFNKFLKFLTGVIAVALGVYLLYVAAIIFYFYVVLEIFNHGY